MNMEIKYSRSNNYFPILTERYDFVLDNCPMLNIPGFTFPVTDYLLEDVIELTG